MNDVKFADVVKKLDEAIELIESRPDMLYYWSTPLKCLYSLKYDRKILADWVDRYENNQVPT
jgi:hypothetical protein